MFFDRKRAKRIESGHRCDRNRLALVHEVSRKCDALVGGGWNTVRSGGGWRRKEGAVNFKFVNYFGRQRASRFLVLRVCEETR